MKLWAANTTKKNIHFLYRIPEGTRLFDVTIPIGAQVEVHRHRDGLDQPTCESLIGQLQRKLNAVEMGSRPEGYVGVTYSVDKPVKAEVIEETVAKNDEVLTAQGEVLRQESAIATHEAIAQSAGANPDDLAKTTISIEEEVKPGETKKVDQTTEVVRNGDSDGTKDKPSTRRKRR